MMERIILLNNNDNCVFLKKVKKVMYVSFRSVRMDISILYNIYLIIIIRRNYLQTFNNVINVDFLVLPLQHLMIKRKWFNIWIKFMILWIQTLRIWIREPAIKIIRMEHLFTLLFVRVSYEPSKPFWNLIMAI